MRLWKPWRGPENEKQQRGGKEQETAIKTDKSK